MNSDKNNNINPNHVAALLSFTEISRDKNSPSEKY